MTWMINFLILVVFLSLALGVAALWLHILDKGDVPKSKYEHEDVRPKNADEIQAAIDRMQKKRQVANMDKTKKY